MAVGLSCCRGSKVGLALRRVRYDSGDIWTRKEIDGESRYGRGSECARRRNISNGTRATDNGLHEGNVEAGDQSGAKMSTTHEATASASLFAKFARSG